MVKMVTWPKGQTWSREQTFERGGMVEGEAKSKEEIRSKKVTWLRRRASEKFLAPVLVLKTFALFSIPRL